MTDYRRRIRSTLAVGLALAGLGLGGCFSADFDADLSGVYYCQSDSDCESAERCDLFRCVNDEGPQLEIRGPEEDGDAVDFGMPSLNLTLRGSGIELVEGSQRVEGEGFLRVSIDGEVVGDRIVGGDLEESPGLAEAVDISGLAAGAHRIRVQAFYSDESPYENPGATAERLFFLDDGQVHVAILEPAPGSQHRVGETMMLRVRAINFTWKDGEGDVDCTQADVEAGSCNMSLDEGHSHVYTLDNYPECLDPVDAEAGCNFGYANSLKPDEDGEDEVSGPLDFDFGEPGTVTISAGLQYNEHQPFPNPVEIRYDQVEVEIIE